MQPYTLDKYGIGFLLDLHTHLPHTGDGGAAIVAVQKSGYPCGTFCQGTQQNGPVGNGLVSRNGKLTSDALCFIKTVSHKNLIISFRRSCSRVFREVPEIW